VITLGEAINEFLRLHLADQEGGRVRSRAEYLALFPGFEAEIAAELDLLEQASASGSEGTSFGPYRLLAELGRGAQGKVWLAQDTRLPRQVALKVLNGLAGLSPLGRVRFEREAEIVSRLEHPGICPVYESGEHEGVPYIAMRYLPGQSLAEWIAHQAEPPRGREELRHVLSWIESIARAAHVAHQAGIVHRDIKPGNVRLSGEGQAVLLDFGVAHDVDARTLTLTGDLFGTPAYMAPEQIAGQARLSDHAVDVHALGVTLYECLTLALPFEGKTRETLFRNVLERPVPDPRRHNPALPRDARAVLEKALEKDPRRRYATALELAEDLARLARGEPVRARAITRPERLLRWARREPLRAGLLAAGVVVASVTGYLGWNWERIQSGSRQEELAERARWIEQGFEELGTGDVAQAERLFDRALAVLPVDPEALFGKGLSLRGRGRAAELTGLLERYPEELVTHPDLEWLRLIGLSAQKDADGAHAAYQHLLERNTPLTMLLSGLRRAEGMEWDVGNLGRESRFFARTIVESPHARRLIHAGRDLGHHREGGLVPGDDPDAYRIAVLVPEEPSDHFPCRWPGTLAGAGDVDGDGRDDLLVSCNRGTYPEATFFVQVRSGADLSVLRTYGFGDLPPPGRPYRPKDFNPWADGHYSVGLAPDIDGDGVRDHLVYCRNYYDPEPTRYGILQLYSGLSGEGLARLIGQGGESLGVAATMLDDLDEDGVLDLLVASDQRLHLWSVGHRTWLGDAPLDGWDWILVAAGDQDGDKVTDFLTCDSSRSDHGAESGAVYVQSTRAILEGRPEEALVRTIPGRRMQDWTAHDFVSLPDLDGDGVRELVLGEPYASDAGFDAGRVRVISGAGGPELYELHGDTPLGHFGWTVAVVGDADGDGYPELAVGAKRSMRNGIYAGSFSVFSGRDGRRLLTIDGDRAHLGLGHVVADGGDVNGDGAPDVLVSCYPPGDPESLDSHPEVALQGEIHVYSIRPLR